MHPFFLSLLLPAALSLSLFASSFGFAQAPTTDEAATQSWLVAPVDFTMGRLPTSGVAETKPQWSALAETTLTQAVNEWTKTQDDKHFVALPDLSAEDAALLDEHIALLALNIDEAYAALMTLGSPMRFKKDAFDYTIGPGLHFLKERTGATHMLFLKGAKYQATAGRWIAGLTTSYFAGYSGPMGGSFLIGAVCNLDTGRIEWFNPNVGIGGDPREAEDASRVVATTLKDYPSGYFFKRVTLAP